ncbi:hypothetical protein BDW66DRAFT_135812 [Aspergillus desertorum]
MLSTKELHTGLAALRLILGIIMHLPGARSEHLRRVSSSSLDSSIVCKTRYIRRRTPANSRPLGTMMQWSSGLSYGAYSQYRCGNWLPTLCSYAQSQWLHISRSRH